LAAGSDAEDTIGRLSDGEQAGEISADLAELLRQGLEVAHRVRLEHHLELWNEGRPFDNDVSLDRLSSWEETLLEQVIKAVREAQNSLQSRYQTGYVR
jgi:signal-transduction protein with cAMP-binding, CBS, and nucleotidyltransferase domain